MKRSLPIVLVASLALAMAPAQQNEDLARTVEVSDAGERSATWTSDLFVGVAPTFFLGGTAGPAYECGETVEGNCEYTLIAIEGLTQAEIDEATEDGTLADLKDAVPFRVGITNYSVPVSDLDIIVYASNANGDKGTELGRVGDLDDDPSEEFIGSVTTTGTDPVKYVLLEVVFFAGAGTYDGYVNVS